MSTLAEWRAQKSLTLAEVAALLGLKGAGRLCTVQRYERGTRFPGAYMLDRIRKATAGAVSADDMVTSYLARNPGGE